MGSVSEPTSAFSLTPSWLTSRTDVGSVSEPTSGGSAMDEDPSFYNNFFYLSVKYTSSNGAEKKKKKKEKEVNQVV